MEENSNRGGQKHMNIYLAGEHPVKNGKLAKSIIGGGQGIKILESFYACEKNKYIPELLPYISDFLLDSGAFTFIRGTHKEAIDWEEYTERYASWINKYDIKKFFELDIDPIVGLQEVERLRKRLEGLTNKQPIPVWHKNRGKEYFIKMCEEYSYVAIGGIVNKEIDRELYERLFPWFIDTAHKNGAKIHGLGYTALANLKKFHFDSVDSTAWLYGNRSGNIYIFNPQTGLMEQHSREGRRLKSQEAAKNNFLEWVKFQNYAERNL